MAELTYPAYAPLHHHPNLAIIGLITGFLSLVLLFGDIAAQSYSHFVAECPNCTSFCP